MEELVDDAYSQAPQRTEWCPECNGYGSSLTEETERCTRCRGSGLVIVAEPDQERPDGRDPARPKPQD